MDPGGAPLVTALMESLIAQPYVATNSHADARGYSYSSPLPLDRPFTQKHIIEYPDKPNQIDPSKHQFSSEGHIQVAEKKELSDVEKFSYKTTASIVG